MKFCQILATTKLCHMANEEIAARQFHTAHLNWGKVFRGEVKRVWDPRFDPNDYEVIHAQLTGDTLDAVREIRRRITGNTLLVVNPDYSIDSWNIYGHHIETIFDVLNCADIIFGQCYATVEFLRAQMRDREIYYCPHPVDTRWLANHAKTYSSRSKEDVIIAVHRDNERFTPHWVLRGSKLENVQKLVTHMVGWNGESTDLSHKIYDHVFPRLTNPEVIDKLYRNAFCIIDHYSYRVQGRTAMEAAGLGVPYFAWDTCDVAAYCYPELVARPGDLGHHTAMLEDLINDVDFAAEVSASAKEKIEFFGFEECEKRFRGMIDAHQGKDSSGSNNGSPA